MGKPEKTSAKTALGKAGPATAAELATEKKRAEALAKKYGGGPELLTLAEARAANPDREITADLLADPTRFDLRYRPDSICGRYPARAIVHYELHRNGTLDRRGNRTDAKARAAIAVRVAKALKTIAAEKKPAKNAKPAKKKKAA